MINGDTNYKLKMIVLYLCPSCLEVLFRYNLEMPSSLTILPSSWLSPQQIQTWEGEISAKGWTSYHFYPHHHCIDQLFLVCCFLLQFVHLCFDSPFCLFVYHLGSTWCPLYTESVQRRATLLISIKSRNLCANLFWPLM